MSDIDGDEPYGCTAADDDGEVCGQPVYRRDLCPGHYNKWLQRFRFNPSATQALRDEWASDLDPRKRGRATWLAVAR
jgi:hypothetical protein